MRKDDATSDVYAVTKDGLLLPLMPISHAEMSNILSDDKTKSIVGMPAYWSVSETEDIMTVWPHPEVGVKIQIILRG